MAKGGYRAGAGRPKGSKTKSKKKVATVMDINAAAASENLTPLEYMLRIMRDPLEDADRRMRAAIACLPFCHARKGEGSGKEDKADRARKAGGGKFKASPPPRLKLVD